MYCKVSFDLLFERPFCGRHGGVSSKAEAQCSFRRRRPFARDHTRPATIKMTTVRIRYEAQAVGTALAVYLVVRSKEYTMTSYLLIRGWSGGAMVLGKLPAQGRLQFG